MAYPNGSSAGISDPTPRSLHGFPLTISQWKNAQRAGGALERLLNLLDSLSTADVAWISLPSPDHVRSQWKTIEALQAKNYELPLFGVPFAVKDNIDVSGLNTTAGCPDFSYLAAKDATVVEVLKRAGAVVIGKTNLDQFATGLVGTRSPYGAVPNTFDARYVCGGSSSGSASVVARGLVPFSLGTDTAGSGRVPAGLNNIVGLKATPGAISTHGVVPACRTLDCVSIFALTLDDAELVFEIAAQYDVDDIYSRPRPDVSISFPETPRIAVCDAPPWFGQTTHKLAYENALEQAKRLGWNLVPTDFSALFKLAAMLYEGPWVAERFAAVKIFIDRPDFQMDPVVQNIISKAKNFSAVDVFQYEYRRRELTRKIETAFAQFDALLVPTTPIFPTIDQIKMEPILENSRLGTFTNFVNFLDWTALAIPAGFREDKLPFGITIISSRWQEPKLLKFARIFLSQARRLGATCQEHRDLLPAGPNHASVPENKGHIPLVVVGAHLSGFPLNYQLVNIGATLAKTTTTSDRYRLYALTSGPNSVPKPGLRRISEGETGNTIAVEIWDVPSAGFGGFVNSIPLPLAIGAVELVDGSIAPGFVCQPVGLENATDISSFGGWRAYVNSLNSNGHVNPVNGCPSSFKSILVANRGEIAVRLISTIKRLGIRAVAIYSAEDANSQHVRDADAAYLLDGSTISETYLSGESIIRIAKSSGVDAILPGYGLLSENSEFAASCEAAGIVWIGPTPRQIEVLGLKHLARDLAIKADVPLPLGSGLLTTVDAVLMEAERVGYPVMLKSTAGGGGIGLIKCATPSELRDAFDTAKRLSQSYFNDDGVFIEHFIEDARHIEIQIIGDGEGRVKHVGERDCSLQRRHQKIIEESPAVFVPEHFRAEIRAAAIRFAKQVSYRNVGTVEFLYDTRDMSFYFLEANTRLQVEHPVTEAVSGIDLVEYMIRVASKDTRDIFSEDCDGFPSTGVAIEARVYAENPLKNFLPSPGELLEVSFPSDVRVDTWVRPGTVVSSSFDPLIAKIIVRGETRQQAVEKLRTALDQTKLFGIETNIEYLKHIARSNIFESGSYTTGTLNSFKFAPMGFEVQEPGFLTTVQDYPGRQGFWHIGLPPSGPMDNYAFRLANRIIGNEPGAAGLECSSTGPSLRFHSQTVVAVVGPPADLTLDGTSVPFERAISVNPGQVLRLGTAREGCRTYIAIRGGIDVPLQFGSRSTFTLGKLGGFNGRELRTGDFIAVKESSDNISISVPEHAGIIFPPCPNKWNIRVMPGPHAVPDFFPEASFQEFFSAPWKVHYNSNRTGIRLSGPTPTWARENGGTAGLHPSNIHDSPYSVGSVSFTGDQAIILTGDGPSLGGFVVFSTVILADMWKLGQLRPGDEIRLVPVTLAEAMKLNQNLLNSIENLTPLCSVELSGTVSNPVLSEIGSGEFRVTVRQFGDSALLLEFGENDFNLRCNFYIHGIMEAHARSPIRGVLELTSGVRSLHVIYDPSLQPDEIVSSLATANASLHKNLPMRIPSRLIRLPFAFEHKTILEAINRYSQTIRAEAPWVPSNTSFLQKLNGLDVREDVRDNVLAATFLVLGLGDVFFGSPCAIPLDPRHRLFGTKYSPTRSFTPEGAVGIGGQYLCIYAMDSPGGYQLVGRTVPIWDRAKRNGNGKPWMFELFDRITFYPISEEEFDAARSSGKSDDLVFVREDTLDLEEYERWLKENASAIEKETQKRWKAISDSSFLPELLASAPQSQHEQSNGFKSHDDFHGTVVQSAVAGRCWKCLVNEGDEVKEGQPVVSLYVPFFAPPITGCC